MVVRVVASGLVGFGVQGGVRVDQGRQRIQRAPDVARVLDHHRDGVGEDGRGDFLDAEHRQRPGPVHGLRDARRLAEVEPAQPADDLDEVLGGRVGQAGLLAPQDLELALGARVVEKQVQAAALERGGQVAGVIRGEDDARRVAGQERAYLRHRYLILGEHFEEDRLQGLVRAVNLVDQQHHGIGRADGFEQRARSEEALGEEGALLLRDPLDRGMQVGGVAEQLADLLPQDLGVQELLTVIPLVQRLGVVLTLVALQPQQPPPGRRGDGLGQLGLADSGGPLDQQGLVEAGPGRIPPWPAAGRRCTRGQPARR